MPAFLPGVGSKPGQQVWLELGAFFERSRLPGDLLAVDFFAGDLLAVDFFAGDLLEEDFLAGDFLALAFFAEDLRAEADEERLLADFPLDDLLADFLAVVME